MRDTTFLDHPTVSPVSWGKRRRRDSQWKEAPNSFSASALDVRIEWTKATTTTTEEGIQIEWVL